MTKLARGHAGGGRGLCLSVANNFFHHIKISHISWPNLLSLHLILSIYRLELLA